MLAVQSRTDFGAPGYGGPCPPQGDAPRHYNFMLFAVDALWARFPNCVCCGDSGGLDTAATERAPLAISKKL